MGFRGHIHRICTVNRGTGKGRVLGALVTGAAIVGAAAASPAFANLAATSTAFASAATASASTATSPGSATLIASTKHSGDVDVLSAGSLQILMEKSVGPGFHKATGYTLVDTSHGSSDLAADIKAKTQVADVFVSASPAVNATLEGAANGSWVSWYATFASSPLVLGYYPKSKFATDLRTEPWYDVITKPGFLVGRTNPADDPGGVLQVKALDETATSKSLPALKTLATETKDVFEEDALEGDVESGQLDAGFMYLADANSDDLPHVDLTGVNLAGNYTITVVAHAPHLAAAEAFVKYLLGPAGQAEMRADEFKIVSPAKVTGAGIPSGLKSIFGT